MRKQEVVVRGPRGEILVGPRALPSEVEPALAGFRPSRPRHDPLPALDLARELGDQQLPAVTVFVSPRGIH